MRRPSPLPPGGTIGIISPSSPSDPAGLLPGIAVLESRGFNFRAGAHLYDNHGHMAGLDTDRAADFMSFYADPTIDVIWCARGGSSSCRIWPYLDWKALAALPPKFVIGYSDATSLQVPLNQLAQTVTIHGPKVFELGTKTPPHILDWVLKLMQSAEPIGIVPMPASDTLVEGVAEGPLCGGCLSLVRNTLGTPYQIDARGKLLFLEDIHETPWSIERDLVQLRETGILESAAGFVIGEATGSDDSKTLPIRQIWADILEPFQKPTVLGFPAGHIVDNYALPMGCLARLDAGERTLEILEAAVGE